jgi:GNAT superfamily N-acetyltransferase
LISEHFGGSSFQSAAPGVPHWDGPWDLAFRQQTPVNDDGCSREDVQVNNGESGVTGGRDDVVVTVRLAVTADVERMHQLAQAAYGCYVPRIGRPPAPMTADYAGIASSGHAWVAEHRGRIVGFLVLEPQLDHLLLHNVAVHTDQQGVGIGGRLLAFAEDQARLLGLPEVRLFTNAAMTANLEYYPHRGYQQTHGAEQNGYQRVFFSKHLPDV